MNERIRELIEQATSHMPGQPPYEGLTFDVFNKEKFAELLVRECADFIEQDQGAGEVLSNRLKKHFGVEE